MDVTPHELHAPPPAALGPTARVGPGIGQALGLLLLYFVLQLVIGGIVGIFVGFISGAAHDVQPRATLSRPDVVAIMVIASVVASAGILLHTVYRCWPLLWTQPRPPGLGFARPSQRGYYGLAMAVGLLLPVAGDVLTQWLARGQPVPQDVAQLGATASPLLRMPLALLAISVGPMVEELLFRGVLLSALMTPGPDYHHHPAAATWPQRGYRRIRQMLVDRFDRWPVHAVQRGRTAAAVLISALIFGLVHLPGLRYLWFAIPNLVLMGTVLAWLRLRSQSIWPAVVAHGLNNLLAVTAWFLTAQPPG